jgi:hypothetical protein
MSGFFKKLFGGFGAKHEQDDAELPIGDLKAGALYSVYNGDESGEFGVVKILVLEPPAVHICVYKNNFATRPEHVDPASLALGIEAGVFENALEEDKIEEMFAAEGFGIAHMPVHLRDFIYGWQPVFIMDSPVTEDELEGYNIWKQEGGGVFGGI